MLNSDLSIIFNAQTFLRLLDGLWVTIRISFIAIVIGTVLGLFYGLLMTRKNRIIRAVCRFYLEIFRIIPILVWLFIFFFGVPAALNIHIEAELAAVVIFTLWGIAEVGDLVRGALESLPKHQTESSKAIGLSSMQMYWHVLIPQAARRVLPSLINLATRMIKTTSLVTLIGVIDVVGVGKQIIERTRLTLDTASFWIYGLIFLIFFCLCYPLSLLSKKLEKRWES